MPATAFDNALDLICDDRSPKELLVELTLAEIRMVVVAQLVRGTHTSLPRPAFTATIVQRLRPLRGVAPGS